MAQRDSRVGPDGRTSLPLSHIDRTLADVRDVGAAARTASDVLNNLSRLFDVERQMLAVERRAVLEGVDQQRLETHGFITSERLALVAALHEERLALVAALRQERIEAIAGIDVIKTRAVEASLAGLRDLVDYAFWRVAAAAGESGVRRWAVRCDRPVARRAAGSHARDILNPATAALPGRVYERHAAGVHHAAV